VRERRAALAAALALGALFVALSVWSWRTWTDPIIDFGLELYLPWRIGLGEVLYRDLAYRNGPLSPYWNAALFALGGVSLRTLVLANLAVLAAIVVMLYRLLAKAFDARGAFAGCALLLVVCGFSQYGSVGNYNFVTPYQHGQTHGLALGLAIVVLCERALRRAGVGAARAGGTRVRPGGARWPAWEWPAAGGLLGLLSLTKAEMMLPGAVVLAAALWRSRRARAAGMRLAAATAAAALAPALAWCALARAMPPGQALRGVLGNLPYLGGTLARDPFYLHTAGFDAPLHNAAAMALAALGLAALAALRGWDADTTPRALPARADGLRARMRRSTPPVALGGAVFAALALSPTPLPWAQAARALPLAVVVIGAATRARPASVLLACHAFFLLAKLGLHPQLQHYGFALAAPALALTGAALCQSGRRAARLGDLRSAAVVGVVAAFALASWRDADRVVSQKDMELPTGLASAAAGDAILVAGPRHSPRGAVLERVLRGLDALMPAQATLLVMPEGATLNYWLRRRNPTPWSLYLPTELAAHGGAAAMLPRLRRAAPDYVVLVHRDAREFGTGPFLRDPRNGAAFGDWLRSDYTLLETVGAVPFRGPHFGVQVLVRRGSAAPAAPAGARAGRGRGERAHSAGGLRLPMHYTATGSWGEAPK